MLILDHECSSMYIASHAKGNVSVLEGALRRVIAFASLARKIYRDIGLASEILQDLLPEPTQKLKHRFHTKNSS